VYDPVLHKALLWVKKIEKVQQNTAEVLGTVVLPTPVK
jgi:hypothetical protein